MPFISHKDKKGFEPVDFYEEKPEGPAFGEVFSASLGGVIDEDMSISRELNREGYTERRALVEELISSGEVDRSAYTKRNGTFDYNRLAEDNDRIKSDQALKDERNELLASRRRYREETLREGGAVPQFLGAMMGFMLDPISVATMPIGYSTGALKGLSAVGNTMMKAGAVEALAETGIQSLVYEHKHDIGAPYEWKDAITNIATAATGGAVLAGGAVGIREYIGHVRAKAEPFIVDDKAAVGYESLSRLEDTLSYNPLRKEGMTSEELIKADSDYLEGLEIRKAAKPKIDIPPREARKVEGNAGLLGKEKSVLSKTGLTDDYAQDMLEYKKRFGANADEMPNLKGVMIDEQVKIKETGEVVTVKSDADVMLRRAQKRVTQMQKLRGCLGA